MWGGGMGGMVQCEVWGMVQCEGGGEMIWIWIWGPIFRLTGRLGDAQWRSQQHCILAGAAPLVP